MKTRPSLALAAVAAIAIAIATTLAGCAGRRKLPGDDQPTLASLAQRPLRLDADPGIRGSEEQTIAAYRQFLQTAPQAPQRAEAMRRLGDLEMDAADRRAAGATGAQPADPDYRAAMARYREFLQAYPQDPRNDRVLYQLARAQEQGGDLEGALKTLTALVQSHPGSVHASEVQFRRGELLFAMRSYNDAERAYAAVLQATQGAGAAAGRSPLHDRALSMHGWSLFKQGRLDEALLSFFVVLDLKLSGLSPASRDVSDLATLPELQRADRELVDDTFRVLSISLAALQGAESVARHIDSPLRTGYEFRVYQQLGELYIRQDRIKDAADTFALFVRRQPLHAQAPLLQARVIAIYDQHGFTTLALQARTEHVQHYGAGGAGAAFRSANPSGWAGAQPLVKTHLADLARHHHALAQKTQAAADVQQAVHWYRELLAAFPNDAGAGASRFLLAELLYDNRRWADAAAEYETVAYGPASQQSAARDPRSADAGYAALLAYAAQDKDTAAAERNALQRRAVASALRFGAAFANDPRSGAVLTRSAEQLYALGDGEQANAVARQALALQPPPPADQRRTAWTVVAHHAFEQARHADAEAAYREVLALSADSAAGRGDTAERLAAAIYKQGEAARGSGDPRLAVGHFDRVAAVGGLPATSAVRASAQLDAAAAWIGLKDWDAAARALEAFRRQQPGHPLQAEVAPKLALAHLELGRHSLAAAEFERIAAAAAAANEPALARGALWQAAELHDKAAAGAAPRSPLLAAAIHGFERYLQQHPQPLQPAVDARWRLAALTRRDGQAARALAWTQAVLQADAAAGDARTPRTRALAGQAALLLAEPLLDAYRKVPLVEPLQKQLVLKRARMEDALRAYAAAAETAGGSGDQVGAEVTTAATFRTAALYQDFGRALTGSARPKKLSKAELEQYTVLLEEQAFPFEEKAIALHEGNARRAAAGVYDPWVRDSFAELARLKPVRWGKAERADAALPQDAAAIEALLKANPKQPALLNQLGIAERRQGRFDQARQAYEAAIALDPAASAAQLNLAILFDLYLGDNAQALALYQGWVDLSPADAPVLSKWLAELKTRKPDPAVASADTVASRKDAQP